jgi:CRP-like cAMP-binding protein
MSLAPIDQLHKLKAAEHRFGAGAFLFHRGDPVRVLHVVIDGEAHLIRHHEDGVALTLQRAGPGAIFAEASLYSDVYHCDAIAVRPTVTLAISRAVLRAELAKDAAFAEAWATYLSREVQAARLRAEILSLRTVAERLDAWLAASDGCLPKKGAWTTVASEIGVSAPALYRELTKRRQGH